MQLVNTGIVRFDDVVHAVSLPHQLALHLHLVVIHPSLPLRLQGGVVAVWE